MSKTIPSTLTRKSKRSRSKLIIVVDSKVTMIWIYLLSRKYCKLSKSESKWNNKSRMNRKKIKWGLERAAKLIMRVRIVIQKKARIRMRYSFLRNRHIKFGMQRSRTSQIHTTLSYSPSLNRKYKVLVIYKYSYKISERSSGVPLLWKDVE